MGKIVKLVDNFDSLYEYVTNEGRTFWFRTNMDAPKNKVNRRRTPLSAVGGNLSDCFVSADRIEIQGARRRTPCYIPWYIYTSYIYRYINGEKMKLLGWMHEENMGFMVETPVVGD